MGDINKLYDNIKQLAGGKIEVGTVEQFTKALGNQDTAKKVYGNLSTVLTKDQIGSENDFLSFVQPSGVLRAPKQNFGIVPSIKMDQPEETTISKTETIQPDYIQKEAPLQIKDLKQNNSLNPNALGGLEKEIEGMYQNNIGTKIGDEHILPIGGGYKNTSGKANVDVQLNRPKTELPETSLYNNTPQLKVLKLKQPDEELKDELQKAHQIYETSNGKDLFSDEINDIIDKQSKGESYNIAGYKEDKAEAPKIGMFSTYVGSLIPKFFSGAYGTIGNTAGFARDFFPMLAQSIGFDVKTPSATDFQRDMGILSKRLNEISEINGDKSIKELHKEGDYLGIAAKVGKDIVGIAPAIIASGSMGGVGFFAANASEEKYDALKLDNTKDQNKSLNAVATGVISGVTMKLALEGMPLLLPYAGKLVTKYGTDEATKLISKSVYGGIATALKHSQSYVLPAAMAVQGMADTYANNVIDYVSGVSNNNNFTQGVQEAGWSGLATGIGFGAKGVLSHKSAVKEAKKNFDTSESGLISFLVEKGLTDGEVADAISLLRFSRNSQEKQGIITKLNNEITKPEYNSKDFSKTEEELIKTSDLLNSYVKSFDTYKSISYKFDKNNEVDRILAQQYLSDNTAPTAEQSNYNANQSQLEAQNPIQSEKIKAEQQLVDLSNKTTGTIQTVKLKDDSEIQIANGTPIFKEDGTFDAEKTGIITHNPKDENGNPVLNEDGTPKILVVDPNSIMSLVSETPVQEAQAEAGSQIDQAVAENEKNDFYPKTYTDYPTEDGQWRVSVNETTGKLEKQMIEVNENAKDEQGRPIVYEIDDPINITDEEYSQMSGKPIPTQGGETEPVLSTEPIVSTEPAPVQDNEVVQDGGSTTEPAPTYPADKNGNVDFKSMTDQQIFNHTKETKGEDAAHSLVGRQITRLQSQIQDNTRSTNKHNEETNKLLAKAKTMQDEVTIQAKQDAKEVSLKEEYTALNSKLGELQSLLPKVEAPAPVETPKVVTTRPEILQLQKEQAQANLDSSETLTPNLATSSEVLQPNVNTSNEVQETPVIEESSVAKPKETPFQKRAKALGEYIDMKDYILRIIAGGQKLKWKGGLESEFRGSNAERLQRRNYIDETNGLTPTELAHQIWNDYGENGNNGEIPGVYNMSDGEILDEVHEVLRTVKSNSDALLQAEERRTIGTYDPTPEEVQIIDAFDDEMFAAVLGITNFTPEQLTTLNDFISGWSEYIQHEQHSINTGTTPKSESNSTERNAISEEGSRTEEVSKEEQFNLTPAKDFGQFETNINWFLKNYGSREMAAIQVELYLNEKPEFGKEYIAKHGITTTDELKIYLGKLQAKLRAGKGNERKAVRSEIAKEKTERNVDEVIKLALEAEAEMQEAIRQSDLKGNSTEQKGTKENSSVLSPIKNGSIVTYEGKQYTINGITSDGKFVDLYEGDKMIHEDIPVESVSNSETLQQSDKTKLSETNNKKLDNQKIAKTENVESLPKSEPSEKVGQTITNMISRDVFRDNVSNSIQNDGQKVLDAHNEKDIATLKSIALKYAKDQGRLEGGGGAGPKKTTTPRRGASIVFQSAQIAISDIESKKQISNLDTLTGGEFSKTKSLQPEKIEDFGEKIEGARKDQIKKYFNKINLNGLTLSTVFPKPAFKYLLESGLNTKEASAIKVAYEFATTTKKRYKNDKEKFLGAVRFYAAYAKTILSENLNIEFANDGWVFTDHGKALIQLRAAAYEKVAKELGNEYLDLDLSKVKIHELTPEATRWMVKKPTEREKYEVQYYVSQSKRFETLEQALDEFLKQVKDNTKTDVVEYKRKLNIYRVSYGTEHFIAYQPSGKPLIKLKEGLKTVQEAVQYKKEFEADLHTMLERILAENKGEKRTVTRLKYTNETARERIGKNWREGKDISTENFANTFGFRGVEYGNWVNQKERQVFLNNTYDSLMDLAQIIGVTPKAISLNGKLALSFGSRGSGGTSAHYEPDRVIINLTKTKGLGSLAHEWFHAVDNYFADFKVSANGMKSAVNTQFKEGTRPEVQQAFKALHNSFDGNYRQRSRMLDMGKSKIYFNLPYELAARAFENYMLTKTSDAGQINDFLANYVSPEDWKGQVNEYPYPLPEESKKIAEAFDNLFSTIEEGENGALFQASDKQLNQSTPEEVSQLTEILLSTGLAKEVKMVIPEEMTAVLEGNEQLHAVSDNVFYSPTEKALNTIQQERGTKDQFKAMLLKNGAKQAEMDWIGFDELPEKLTKSDIQQWIDENRIEVKEVVKGGGNYDEFISFNEAKKAFDKKIDLYGIDDLGNEMKIDSDKNFQNAVNFYFKNHKGKLQPTKFSQYVLPGGENYKELLLTMPQKPITKPYEQWLKENFYGEDRPEARELYKQQIEPSSPDFKSSHFDEPNILAHIRFNERTVNGEKVLFIEEFQSDWAQKGKKEGFKDNTVEPLTKDEQRRYDKLIEYGRRNLEGEKLSEFESLVEKRNDYIEQQNSVPDMPFKKTDQWVNLAVRRMMRYAAENGFDRISWTTGEQQADRYDLSKKVKSVEYYTYNKRLIIHGVDKLYLVDETDVPENKIEDYIGKEAAKKLLNSVSEENQGHTKYKLENTELKVGGEGMKAFYDAIVPSAMSRLGKPFGAKVETIGLNTKNQNADDEVSFSQFEKEAKIPEVSQVQSILVTESMKKTASEGMPLFMRKPDGTIYGFVKDGVVYLNSEKPNLNTPIHEFGHLFTPIIKSEHPEFYQKGVELIKESPYYDQVNNDPNYSNLDEDGIIDEAMNQAIGDKGEKVVEKGLFERLKEWIKGVWERIGAKFGIKNLTSEQIQDLTLNDWTDIVNSELLSGNKLTSNSEFVKNSKVKDVVYHGGANDISIFDKTKLGSYSGADSAKKGFFFTNDKTLAEDFAYDASFVISKYKQPDILKLIEKSDFDKIGKYAVGVIKDDYDFEAYDSVNDYLNQNGYINSETPSEKEYKEAINKFASENLYYGLNDSETVNEYKTIFKNLGIEVGKVSEVNINIENPLVVEKKIDFSDEDGLTHYIDKAIKNGNDGVIFNSVTEIIGGSKKIAKQYVVFEPTQIKSATGNDGSFSENNANFVEEKQIAYENEQEAIQKTIDFVSSERPTRIPLDNSRGYAEIHKRSVIEGFKESGYVDFVGRNINSIDDVVDMWNIHRSPYIEKSHIIFVKDGSIIGTTATTLNKVGITAFGKVEDIETLYNKFVADGMYLLHNHPSGNHKPSSGDIQTTQKIKDLLPEVNLIGHIIIDHDKYSYINPAKDGYKEFEQKNAPAKLFYERELVGNNPQKRLFEISKALLNGEGLKGAIIYLSPKLDINAYDVFPEGATQETIAELTKQGLKNNLGQVAIITHDGTFDKDWKVPANVVDVIDTKTGYSTYFENEKSDVITSNDILKLWEPTTNYPKPQPPVFTSDDTLVDQVRKTRNYEETLQRWQERQIGNLATQNGERLSPATISKLNKDINSVTSKLWEGWADAALPIKEFQKFLEKNGVPISDNDNYYMRLTTVPSRIEYRFNQFKEETMKPFIDTLKAIEKNGFTYDDITTYAKLKHGPEYTANILVREYTNKIEAERAKIEDITGSKDWTTKNQKLDQKIIDFKSTIFDYIEQQGIDYAGRDSIEKRIGETADNFITNFESENGSLVDEFWKQSKEVSHYALDEEVRGGMRTKESAEAIKGMFDYYVPLKGHREPTAETTWDYSMEHGDFFFSAVKKGKGRTSESDDPFSIMESTVRSAIGAAEQNLQLQSIRRLALKDTTGSMTVSKTWFVKVGEDENGNPEFKVADEVPFEDTDTNETYNEKVAKFEEKMKELKSKGEAYQGGSERLKLGLWIKPTNEREHEVVVKSNGESYTIRFHTSPRVPQAINGTNMRFYEGTFGAVLDGLGWATRHMAGFKTLWRPAFILVTNPLRDIHAGLNLAFIDEGAKFTANTVLNFRHAQAALLRRSLNKHDLSNKYDKMLNDFMVLGGKTGISKIMELKEIQKSIEKQMKSGKDPIGGVFDFYHAVSDITENQMRVAIYITAIEKGYSSLKATSMAKEATVNFDRKGNGRNGLRELKATYAFINVGFQAIDNIYSKSTKNTETKKRALLAIAANVLSGSLLVAAINTAMCALFGWDEDKWLEDFSKRSSFARNANFTIWTPEKLIDIPLGQEFRMYHGLGMDLMMMAHGKVSVMETSMNMIKGLSSQLPYNPIESSLQGSWASAMPDFASPLAELAANKSWLGYGIYKQNQDEAAPGYTKIKTNKKGEPYAPEVMIKLSKWLNEGTGGDAAEAGWLGFVNPDIADHLLGGYFAGIYEQPLTLLEATLSDKEGSLIKELTPRAILKNTADIQSRDTGLNEKYYKAKDEAEKVDKLIGRAEKAIGLLDKNSPDYEAQKEKYQYKIDKLKTDELYNIQGTQKTISALEKTLDEISPKEQVKTEKEISELKKNIVKINSGEKVDPKNYTEYISKYYGIVKKVEEYKTKMVLGEAEKDSELEKLHSKIFKSHGKLKSINAKINTLEKDTKKNPSNREKNEAQIITLIKKL